MSNEDQTDQGAYLPTREEIDAICEEIKSGRLVLQRGKRGKSHRRHNRSMPTNVSRSHRRGNEMRDI